MLTAVGYGLSNSSFALALNSYFRARRTKAAGIAMTLTGIGPIVYPPMIHYLLSIYGVTGCMLVVAALALNMLVAAVMLQPIDWHLIEIVEDQELALMGKSTPAQIARLGGYCSGCNIAMPKVTSITSIGRYDSFIFPEFPKVNSRFEFSSEEEMGEYMERSTTKNRLALDHDIDAQSIYGFDQLAPVRSPSALLPDQISIARNFSRRTLCQNSFVLPNRLSSPVPQIITSSQSAIQLPPSENKLRWYESGSLDSIHLGSSAEIFKEAPVVNQSASKRRKSSIFVSPFRRQSLIMTVLKKNILSTSNEKDENERERSTSQTQLPTQKEEPEEEEGQCKYLPVMPLNEEKPSRCQSIGRWIVDFFDLGLLRDKVYLNMMLGMSIAIFAEMNFAVLTPFILSDLGYSNGEIASILSIIATADIISRFVSPFVADRFLCSIRVTYVISLVLLVIARMGKYLI